MSLTGVNVLYVLGLYRSGTTILSNMLGQLDGFFCVGELRALWKELGQPGRRCGCGEKLGECRLWASILSSAFGDRDPTTATAEMRRWQLDALWDRHTWARTVTLLRRGEQEMATAGPLARYGAALRGVYEQIATKTGCSVVVDSSKEPTDAALLGLLPGLRAHFVQIVRDPRGTVYSGLRLQAGGRPVDETQWPASVYAAMSWSAGNAAAALVRRRHGTAGSMLVRYEDFVADPQRYLAAIADMVGQKADVLPLGDDGTVTLAPTHTVSGNDNRFRTGRVELRQDTAWRAHLNPLDRMAVTAMCAPMLVTYGYPLGTPRGRAASRSA